ncbi:11S globulin seed storage protein G3-like protein [Tanacetum coccineum]|uniref:11S globulin seed storage protein G3-like protein n=1 Tax=Tanacetum coccineum TaxID=301880 RepID=A0ABQ5A5W4_9ASTR
MSPSLFKAIVTQIAAVVVLCVQSEPSYRPLIADVLHSFIPLISYMVILHKRFFLVGNSQMTYNKKEGKNQIRTWGWVNKCESQLKDSNNLFQGFDGEFLAEAFGVDQEIRHTLKCENDQRRHIVVVEKGLKFSPIMSSEQQRVGHGPANSLEESICSMKLRENIDDVSKAGFFKPTTSSLLQLSVLRAWCTQKL